MSSNLFFVLPGIIFISTLLKVYFSKKRFVSLENKIYIGLIMSNLISLILAVSCILVTTNVGTSSIVSLILTKLYLASILAWLFILTTYVFVASFRKMEKFSLAETTSLIKVLKVLVPFGVLCLVTIFVLPINFIDKALIVFFDGLGVYAVYIITFILTLIWFLRCAMRTNYIKKNKSNFILYIASSVLVGNAIQILYPELFIYSFVMYFVTLIMYYGIDNPDLDLIKKLEATKKQVEEIEVSTKDSLLKVSHQIRTPLNAIVGFSDSILDGTSENVNEDVNQIKVASEKLLNIVNNILDVSEVDMGMYKLVFGSYNSDALFKQIVSLAKSKITSKKVQLSIMVDDNMPPFLFGDSVRIKEIILNVLCNAIKYTKNGDIVLDISCVTVGNICRLIITVKDTGVGISESKLEKLFDAKVNVSKELMEGISDLNFATMKNIVESMNGQITVESEYREGTIVKVVIDQKIGVDPNSKELDESEEDKKRKLYLEKKILIVDDDNVNLKVANRLLMRYGVTTEEVSSGFKCIEKIENGEKYDLILLDDWMPQLSGIETLRQLNKIEGFNTPVVALTANAMAGMKDKYIKDGFNDFIPKPIERKELSRVMEKFLKNDKKDD